MSKAITILEEKIDELEGELQEYRDKEAEQDYRNDWHWRHTRTLTEAENLKLPIPRLEVRVTLNDGGYVANYGLVYKHFLGEITFNPLGSTKVGCGNRVKTVDVPFREGAHVLHDKEQMGLRAYLVCGEQSVEIIDRSEVIKVRDK